MYRAGCCPCQSASSLLLQAAPLLSPAARSMQGRRASDGLVRRRLSYGTTDRCLAAAAAAAAPLPPLAPLSLLRPRSSPAPLQLRRHWRVEPEAPWSGQVRQHEPLRACDSRANAGVAAAAAGSGGLGRGGANGRLRRVRGWIEAASAGTRAARRSGLAPSVFGLSRGRAALTRGAAGAEQSGREEGRRVGGGEHNAGSTTLGAQRTWQWGGGAPLSPMQSNTASASPNSSSAV